MKFQIQKFLITILVLFAYAAGLAAQYNYRWASARQRHLKGSVHVVTRQCTGKSGQIITEKYEFARDGKLLIVTEPQAFMPDIMTPESRKVKKRNTHGDAEEVFYFFSRRSHATVSS